MNEAFHRLLSQYHSTFERYFRHMKVAHIEKDVFLSECHYVLWKSMLLFDVAKSTAETEKFERYFISALKKRCNSIKRTNMTKRRKSEKFAIPFCLKKHDIPDCRIIPVLDQLAALDVIHYCSKLNDKGIVRLRYNDYSAGETCKKLSITPQEYRATLKRVRANSVVNKVFSRE